MQLCFRFCHTDVCPLRLRAQRGAAFLRQTGPCTCVAWRPDGNGLMVGLDDGSWQFRSRAGKTKKKAVGATGQRFSAVSFRFFGEYMYSYCVLDKLDMYVYLLLLNKKVWDALLLRIFPFGAWTPQRGTP